jgi:hypothetical protein
MEGCSYYEGISNDLNSKNTNHKLYVVPFDSKEYNEKKDYKI